MVHQTSHAGNEVKRTCADAMGNELHRPHRPHRAEVRPEGDETRRSFLPSSRPSNLEHVP
ncbi:hypothetical protein SNOG_13657 [Parastagonospora nodorum SN15]|uniref:Uncharacterized protein n=1 Tax=Phaeosphaeria nodorum (strain SN15 / ATCC MYA-4574 / FGSC 10173) TaxID=321614 RepID=Q0U3K7_PHANO|nr:hypothetical protein SNOG_13657 [Parastagonospora nodorum SN15]EAT79104.1 hypothetical protein SNOG_13657 [Parastagonospora nodorum SN15]